MTTTNSTLSAELVAVDAVVSSEAGLIEAVGRISPQD
jgi:hypothetical protein